MRSPRARLLVAAAVLAGLLVAWLLWRRHHTGTSATARDVAGSHSVSAQTGSAGHDARAHWLATNLPGRHIAGIVVGEDGTPVAGAVVRLTSKLTIAGASPQASVRTDATGKFDLGVVQAMVYIVSAESPKTTAAMEQVDLRDPRPTPPPDQLRLLLHACIASIHGTVYDTTEGPIRGATVSRRASGWTTQVAVEADDKGNYELCVPVGDASVMVSADGYAPRAERVDVYGRTRRDFRLVPGAPLAGRVVKADDKSPVGGALVEVRGWNPLDQEPEQTAMSNDDGTFHFDAVAPGKHLVTAEAERLATSEPVEAIAELGAPNDDTVCELVVAPTVSGHVVDQATKKPVAGVGVFLDPSDERIGRAMNGGRYAKTQDDGSFVFDRAIPGDYSVFAGSWRVQDSARKIMVEHDDITGLVLEVMPRASVEGRVVAGGKPVDGADVRIGPQNETSDSQGHFLLDDLPAGTHEMYAESKRVGAFTRGSPITLSAGEHKTGVEISLDLAGSISGTVVDQNDAPVAGAFLSFSLLHGRDFGSATTADDGSFTAGAMSGGGDYIFEVRPAERSPLVYPPTAGKHHPPVTVADGKTHVTGLRVKVRIEKLAISGRVVDAAGKPVSDARVTAVPHELGWYRAPEAISDESGAFTVNELQPGAYKVQAATAHGEGAVEGVAPGTKNVMVTLLAPGGIDGKLEGFSKTPHVSAVLMSNQGFRSFEAKVTSSTFQLRDLPPGRYSLSARAGDERASGSADVVATQIKTVTLTVGQVGVVVGTVVDGKSKAPLAGLRCQAMALGQDSFEFNRSSPMTDAKGAFRIERAPAGDVNVVCTGDSVSAWASTTVNAGQVATVSLVAESHTEDERGKKAGMTLENQLDEVLVDSVEPGGPAAKAGIRVGDVVESVNDKPIGRFQAGMAMMLIERESDAEAKVVLERHENGSDKQLTVTLKLAP